MRIPYPCKPHAAAATPSECKPPYLNVTHYLPALRGAPALVSSNGAILAVLPVAPQDGDGFNGQAHAMTADAMKAATRKAGEPELAVVDDRHVAVRAKGQTTTFATSGEAAPHSMALVVADCNPGKRPGGAKLCLDVALLARLADALGSQRVNLYLPEPDKRGDIVGCILATPADKGAPAPDAFGLIMPVVF